MNRLQHKFQELKQKNKKALVVYMTAGDPDFDASLNVLDAACAAGLDVLELGVPFSDPTSDGPTIEAAAGRALKNGMTLKKVLELASRLRAKHTTPFVLFSYYNPLLQFGLSELKAALRKAGIDGMLVVDLPPEEAGELKSALEGSGISLIRLIAPTTHAERIKLITADADGFLYMITRTGVTGGGTLDMDALEKQADAIRKVSDLPICFGFGISTPDDARNLAPLCDGVVVGSALVKLAHERQECGDAAKCVAAQVKALLEAL